MKNQRGFSLIETMFVLLLITLAVSGAFVWQERYYESLNQKETAQHAKLVADAAGKYVKDNYSAVLAAAGPTTPATITVAMLRATNYLPSGFSDRNNYGQTYTIRAIEPTANLLQTVVLTTGGSTIPELGIRRIAKLIGAKGGYISTTNTALIQGSSGGWQIPLAPYSVSPGAGRIGTALFVEDGAVINDYLHRSAVPGHPEVNRMNTAINMNSNDITNGGVVTAATINGGTVNSFGHTTAGAWLQTSGNNGWRNTTHNGGWYMSDPSWLRSVANKGIYTEGEMRAGTLRSLDRTTVGEYLQLSGVATEGTACSPNGLVSRNIAGLTLSCQSGVWFRMYKPTYVITTLTYVNNQPGISGYPNCESEPGKSQGEFQWALSCGNRSCQSLGFVSGLVQEYVVPANAAGLSCF